MRYYGLNKAQTIDILLQMEKQETAPQYTLLEAEQPGTNRCFAASLSVQDILTLFSVGEWVEGIFQDKSRIRDLSNAINRDGMVLINPMITVALWKEKASLYNIVPFQIADVAPLSNPVSILKIDWASYYKSLIDLPEKNGFFVNAKARLGLVLDGYQRLFAAVQSGKLDYCFPVNIIIIDSQSTVAVYKNIKQSEYESAQFNFEHREDILQMFGPDIFQSVGGASEPKVESILLAKTLNEESTIFAGRIQTGDTSWKDHPGRKRPVAKQSSMEKLLVDWIAELHNMELLYPEIHVSSNTEKVKLLDNYFGAWKQCWPDAWLEDTTNPPYMLCKTTGISLLFKLFTPITMNVLKASKDLSMENYVEVLKKAYFEPDGETPITLHFPGKDVLLNWESKNFSEFSSGAGKNKLCRQLELYLY